MRVHPANKAVVGLMIMMFLSAAAAATAPQPDCERRCGNLEIPYPFGMKKGCYLSEDFLITCNKTHYNPPQPFVQESNIEVTNISITNGELQILHYRARDCYSQNGTNLQTNATLTIVMFTVSSSRNKFTAIGCDTVAFISGEIDGESYKSGCLALCANSTKILMEHNNGACSGNGCCQVGIPEGLNKLEFEVRSLNNHAEEINSNPCGYAFLIQQNKFKFSPKYIQDFPFRKVPLVLDWGIPIETCSKADNKTHCFCGSNSRKISFLSSNYRCQCLEGFTGNPYLHEGCQGKNLFTHKYLDSYWVVFMQLINTHHSAFYFSVYFSKIIEFLSFFFLNSENREKVF